MSTRPTGPPIGLQLSGVARAVSRAFDDALSAAGGSRSTWLVLMSLKSRPVANQRELAAAVGIQGATLTHHLNAMETDGLLTRRRDPANRRVHLVELTEQGEAAFHRLRGAAAAFDRQLRTGLETDDVERLSQLLARLHDNVTDATSTCDPDGTDRATSGQNQESPPTCPGPRARSAASETSIPESEPEKRSPA